MKLEDVFKNNEAWVKSRLDVDEEYFQNLAKGQSPELLYIGCSDSRVTPELFMGAEPGDAFVHRNIANIVDNTDLNGLSVINYAVVHLKVKHVVVCGHYECGGVKAAMQTTDMGRLNPWIRNIRDVYRLHQQELDAITDESARYRRLVELNVQEQCINLIKMATIQNAQSARGLNVHGWVFDIGTGKLIDLELDFPELLKNIGEIYKLS